MSTILIAPDSFKGSATSIEVAAAIAQGWRSERPIDRVIEIPFADGGEGTLLAIEYAQPTAIRNYCPEISPGAYWLLLADATAVVELAQVSGLTLLDKLDPLGAHTFVFGQLLANAAKDSRVKRMYCALGGSASTDGGVGALMALGYIFLDKHGIAIGLGGAEIARISEIDKSNSIAPPIGGVVLLVDVQSPLLGINGAAAVFAPQKGASPLDVQLLESALLHFAECANYPDNPGSGAAGGTAYGLNAYWGARIESGATKIAELCGLNSLISDADLIITGEGRLDSQSLQGKVVGYIMQCAELAGVPIAYCVGSIDGEFPTPSLGGVSLTDFSGGAKESIENPQKYLFEAGVQLAHFIEDFQLC